MTDEAEESDVDRATWRMDQAWKILRGLPAEWKLSAVRAQHLLWWSQELCQASKDASMAAAIACLNGNGYHEAAALVGEAWLFSKLSPEEQERMRATGAGEAPQA